jgi:hypothetical protein
LNDECARRQRCLNVGNTGSSAPFIGWSIVRQKRRRFVAELQQKVQWLDSTRAFRIREGQGVIALFDEAADE